jgi:5'-nucleotidase
MRINGLSRRLLGAILGAAMVASLATALPAGAQNDSDDRADGRTASAVNETVGRVERGYITLLGRSPDDGGLRYWLDRQANGLSYQRIVQFFLDSPERRDKYPSGQTDMEFLEQLYEDAFGRAPDPIGVAYWMGQLAGGMSRDQVALFFIDSAEQRAATEPNPVFDLNIFHINDHHSNLDEDDIEFTLGGVTTETELGGFPRVVAKFDELMAANVGENNLKLHAGDAITGTLFYTLFEGEADADLMNEVCFDAFALGNHEFDGGDAGLVTFLDYLAEGDCDTPVLAANVIPQRGTPLDPGNGSGYLQAFTIESFGDEQVGIIGLDIAQKTQVSSSPLDTTQFLDEAETAQYYIDILEGMGVDKIVLLTHYTYAGDQALASLITGADLIVGGDSHTLLGDFDAFGLSSGGPYPTQTVDASGLPVCIVQAWQYSNVVGEFNASFDQYGHVASCGGTPHLLLGDGFTKEVDDESVPLSASEEAAVLAALDAIPSAGVVTPDVDAQAILAAYKDEVDVLSAEVIGTATENLCLARIPADTGRTDIPACVDGGVPNGGDIQQLVAYAFADRAFDADFALQNSGGVRIDIPVGPISIGDAYTLLPFANTMVNLEMTGAEVKQALEDGVSNILDAGGSSGAYPYGAYLRWDMDFTQATDNRISNLEIRSKADGSTWGPIDPAATYTVVVNSFMAGGGDGYDTLETVFDAGRGVDTYIDYAQGFVDYVVEDLAGSVGRVAPADYSTQNFTPAAS